MTLRIIASLMLVFFQASILFAAPPVPQGGQIKACSAIVFDLDNDVILFEQNADQHIPPASLTKVLSMFLALDYLKEGHTTENALVPISKEAAWAGGSSMGIRPGEEIPFKKLLFGMAVSSGNDASHAIAEFVGGSVPAFVKMMNARAQKLGMTESNFQNPHGLPADNQYTTARDMLTLARAYLHAHPYALDFHNTRTLNHAGYTSWNKNPLLGQYPGADGLKSGWIRASGYNLIFTATKDNRRLLAVILGSPDPFSRGGEACRLLDAGFLVCGNQAVSVAAALDDIPLDLNRIDPLKTGREHGLLKNKVRDKQLLALKNSLRPKNLRGTPTYNSRLRKPVLAHKSQAAKSKRKDHASRPTVRARRS